MGFTPMIFRGDGLDNHIPCMRADRSAGSSGIRPGGHPENPARGEGIVRQRGAGRNGKFSGTAGGETRRYGGACHGRPRAGLCKLYRHRVSLSPVFQRIRPLRSAAAHGGLWHYPGIGPDDVRADMDSENPASAPGEDLGRTLFAAAVLASAVGSGQF